MKLFALFFLLIFVHELNFTDSFGNEFFIKDSKHLSKEIDFKFLKENLNTRHFINNFTRKTYIYKFNILEIHKKRNKYKLKVQVIPQTKDLKNIEDILKHMNPSYYILETSKSNGIIEIKSVEFINGEI
ncbi:hypothetical protein [Flavobacterium sp.]|jgi:hypothetical protein|uniref:hypothetical protein n=1 Tax=Flavobacterium sp. TaxID=239 RepID=UPI0037BF23B8